jgi:hypothetical protein
MKGLLRLNTPIVAKCYVCTRFPYFRIGNIRFRKGCYVTHDQEQQKLVEPTGTMAATSSGLKWICEPSQKIGVY